MNFRNKSNKQETSSHHNALNALGLKCLLFKCLYIENVDSFA